MSKLINTTITPLLFKKISVEAKKILEEFRYDVYSSYIWVVMNDAFDLFIYILHILHIT